MKFVRTFRILNIFLIEKDFELMYPHGAGGLLEHWPQIAPKVLKLASENVKVCGSGHVSPEIFRGGAHFFCTSSTIGLQVKGEEGTVLYCS